MSDSQKSKLKNQKEKGTKQRKRLSTQKDDIISWDEYFMGIAFLSAKRSKYEVRKVGACIVNNEKRIVATGYNGYIDPPEMQGNQNNDELFSEEEKSKSVCHAEMNAVINRHSTSLKDCTAYVTFFPCNECAKLLAQSRISKVIYYANDKSDEQKYKLSRKMLEFAKIQLQYQCTCSDMNTFNSSCTLCVFLIAPDSLHNV
ncbi:deoxycytidylate deaminase-like [Saccostrea echinata]|uniref:deoxycytidylate deaminase-like n=1 Tax=Saccostrea echinata TaxID=191078 RepID=UPI002A81972A|nr:deoxycytidylate deaminase-like [Saccostrea echinata]